MRPKRANYRQAGGMALEMAGGRRAQMMAVSAREASSVLATSSSDRTRGRNGVRAYARSHCA